MVSVNGFLIHRHSLIGVVGRRVIERFGVMVVQEWAKHICRMFEGCQEILWKLTPFKLCSYRSSKRLRYPGHRGSLFLL